MGTIPTRAAFVAGAKLLAAQLNEMRSVDDFWALTPRCSVYQSAAQSVPTSGTWALGAFDSEVYDIVQSGDSPSHDNVTLNSRIVFRTPGKYEICGQYQAATNVTGYRAVQIRLNAAGNVAAGTLVTTNQQGPVTGASTSVPMVPVELAVVSGDYIETFFLQTSGGALNTVPGSGVTFMRAKLTGT